MGLGTSSRGTMTSIEALGGDASGHLISLSTPVVSWHRSGSLGALENHPGGHGATNRHAGASGDQWIQLRGFGCGPAGGDLILVHLANHANHAAGGLGECQKKER